MKPQQLHSPRSLTFSDDVAPAGSTFFERWALRRIQYGVATARIRFTLWDGYSLSPASGAPVATIRLKNRRALLSWLWDPELNFGEAYMFGAVDISGDLGQVLEEIYKATPRGSSFPRLRTPINDEEAAKANVHSHYDLGNEFYRLWLDREMVYTCAYFPNSSSSLEEAQVAKMDRICRKLHLQPGERVVEAGCGWGALALFMAREYGVSVRAFNLSTEQIAYARERARALGLSGRVEFVQDDYRNVQGTFDAFVSVGMLEHVGVTHYRTFGAVIKRSLTPNGRGLLHFIGRDRQRPLNAWIRKRIFPGAYPPTLREVCESVLEPQDLSVLDVENLRPHYATTLDHWLSRFDESSDRVATMFDEPFVRAWRLYLAGSRAAFATGWMQLFQIVFSRGTGTDAPWGRLGS